METVKEKVKEFTGIRAFKATDMINIIESGTKEFGLKMLGDEHIRTLAQTREESGQCLTGIVNDEIVGCGGIDLIWTGVGEVWLFLSFEVDKYPIRAYEVIRDGLAKLIEGNSLWRTETWCRKGFAKGHSLLRHLGFKVEGIARRRSPDGVDYILYAVVSDEHVDCIEELLCQH